jgi:tetratricopeptide (TPR) repeat protein
MRRIAQRALDFIYSIFSIISKFVPKESLNFKDLFSLIDLINKRLKIVLIFLFNIGVLIIVILFLKYLWLILASDNRLIERFNVSENLQKLGYTSEAIQNRLYDEINKLREPAETQGISITPGSTVYDIAEFRKEIIIPKINIGFESLLLEIKKKFGYYPTIISGDITEIDNYISFTIRISKISRRGTYKHMNFKGHYDEIDSLISMAAEFYLRYFDVDDLALHYIGVDNKKALEYIKYGLSNPPENDDSGFYNLWGLLLYEDNQNPEAAKKFKRAIDLKPNSSMPHMNLGLSYSEAGDTTRAIEEIKKAIKLDPDNKFAYLNLGNILANQGKYKKATEMFKIALEIDRYYAPAYSMWGLCFRYQNNLDSAIVLSNIAVDLAPNSQIAIHNLGVCYEANEDYLEAMNLFRRSIGIDSTFGISYSMLGKCFKEMGNLDSAIILSRKGVNLAPRSTDALYILGLCYWSKKEYKNAADNFGRIIVINPVIEESYSMLGNCLREIGLIDSAIVISKIAVNLFPNSAAAICNLGSCYELNKEFKKAIELFKKAIDIDSLYINAYGHLGFCLGQISDFQAACNIFDFVTQIDTLNPNPIYYFNWGRSLELLGNIDEAIQKYKIAIDIDQEGEISFDAKKRLSLIQQKNKSR